MDKKRNIRPVDIFTRRTKQHNDNVNMKTFDAGDTRNTAA